jgi:hypothetical protein
MIELGEKTIREFDRSLVCLQVLLGNFIALGKNRKSSLTYNNFLEVVHRLLMGYLSPRYVQQPGGSDGTSQGRVELVTAQLR